MGRHCRTHDPGGDERAPMPKIVIIGAGSRFGSTLSVDILCRTPLQGAQIVLVDIHRERLERVHHHLKQVVEHHQLPATIEATMDREEALPGADFVITSVSIGGHAYAGKPWADEINIPLKYGVDQSVADTLGPGGVFRFLRTGPEQLAFCHDIERLCPNALMLNYTNPMCMLTWLHTQGSSVANVGLCHSVQHTMHELARYLDVPRDEMTCRVAGINHQAWFLELRRKGVDLYPRLCEAMNDPDVYAKDSVRFEMMKQFGYFVTESSHHNSEYLPYFRRTAELRSRFGLQTREVPDQPRRRKQKDNADENKMPALSESNEFASGIIEAVVTHVPFQFNGNVINTGLIPNLPQGCCVEVTCLVDANGVQPCYAGPLPTQCAALNRTNVSVQELAVQAVLERDREAAFHAVALDPLTAAVAPLHKIREMFEELWDAERHLLEWFETPSPIRKPKAATHPALS